MPGFRKVFLFSRLFLGLLVLLGVVVATEAWMRLVLLPWHRRGTPAWHRSWNRLVRAWGVGTMEVARIFLRLRVEVEGTIPASGRYLVVANHQSSLDIPFLIWLFRPLNLKFVAHAWLKYGKPAVSLGLRNGGFAFVHKTNPREDLLRLRVFASSVAANEGSPAIFPEGIRTFDGTIGPFGVTAIRTIREGSGLPVLPVVHDGLWKARSIREIVRLDGATLRVRIFDPVPAEHFTDRNRTAYREVEETIRRGLAEMRGEEVVSPPREVVEVGARR